jgi:hypothetical protein
MMLYPPGAVVRSSVTTASNPLIPSGLDLSGEQQQHWRVPCPAHHALPCGIDDAHTMCWPAAGNE